MADLELVRITPEYAGKKHSTFAVPLQVATSNSETPTKSLADVILRFPSNYCCCFQWPVLLFHVNDRRWSFWLKLLATPLKRSYTLTLPISAILATPTENTEIGRL